MSFSSRVKDELKQIMPEKEHCLRAEIAGILHGGLQEEDPKSLNPLLAYLLSPEAAPLNGSDLRADGGMTMYYGQRANEPVKATVFAPSPALFCRAFFLLSSLAASFFCCFGRGVFFANEAFPRR